MAMAERQVLLRSALVSAKSQPRCFGVAKNFMTNALKADPKVVLPAYPWIFHKPFPS